MISKKLFPIILDENQISMDMVIELLMTVIAARSYDDGCSGSMGKHQTLSEDKKSIL
jgi:hypothetical protein